MQWIDLVAKVDAHAAGEHELQGESKVCACPVAQSAAAELVVSDDRSLIVHSHGRMLPGESVGCVVVGWELICTIIFLLRQNQIHSFIIR